VSVFFILRFFKKLINLIYPFLEVSYKNRMFENRTFDFKKATIGKIICSTYIKRIDKDLESDCTVLGPNSVEK